ncbi:hypothetical protein H1C71_030535 [Ictidomys tridecemlineatus]|nr:hypothetical protein H1C71_030535 [Ictidomys tridecemlineatus]
MSSADETSLQGDGLSQNGGKPGGVRPAGHRALRGLGRGLELRPPRSGEGEGGLLDSEAYEFNLEAPWEEIEEGRAVLPGRAGRPGSPADEKGDALDFVPVAVESEAVVQQPMGPEPRGAHRYPSPESFATELSGVWVDAEAGPGGRAALAPSCVEAPQASAAPLSHPSGPEGSRAWGKPKRGTKSRMVGSGEAQQPSSDPESSDELSEIQLMRVSICPKGGGQARSCSPREPGDPARRSSVRGRENFLHMPGPLPTPAPRGLPSGMDKQASAELEAGSSKKTQSMLWGKGGSRSSSASAAAATGDLPRATPRKKAIQEKKSLGGGSRVTLGRAFPSWGQRLKVTPLEPATFPPISGVPLLGRSKRHSLLPLGPKQSKHGATGKRSVAKKTRESQPVTSEDNDPSRDIVPQVQLPVHRPGTPCLCMHRGEFISGDPNPRVLQPPGSSQPLDLSQGGLAPSGEQDPPVQTPVLERQQQPPGVQGCPRCVLLQKEIDDLKEQLGMTKPRLIEPSIIVQGEQLVPVEPTSSGQAVSLWFFYSQLPLPAHSSSQHFRIKVPLLFCGLPTL